MPFARLNLISDKIAFDEKGDGGVRKSGWGFLSFLFFPCCGTGYLQIRLLRCNANLAPRVSNLIPGKVRDPWNEAMYGISQ